ncbi:hypothetical protein K466DRAFT_579809 [Polyporus arcularius HHB13444]|uniref:Uncharacterized protein n=1 Tax=Polyporus arcularius HHB13444 TaxID=1314778 RepID=A0A5C3Q0G8_9APHY|nr:hypothetical protein K466DRAFT_579809 [Polyporus arcularius HHB13444]
MPGFLLELAHVNRTIHEAERSNWEHCLQHDWIAFKEDLWGAAGQIYVRPDFKLLFNRISKAHNTKCDGAIPDPGVVITASSGKPFRASICRSTALHPVARRSTS